MELQEQEIALLAQTIRSLSDAQEFERKLAAPSSAASERPRPGSA
jgi:hypothetical protein